METSIQESEVRIVLAAATWARVLAGRLQFRRKIELQQVNYWIVGSWTSCKGSKTVSPITDKQTIPQLHFHLKLFNCLLKVSDTFSVESLVRYCC